MGDRCMSRTFSHTLYSGTFWTPLSPSPSILNPSINPPHRCFISRTRLKYQTSVQNSLANRLQSTFSQMASSLALKRSIVSPLFSKLLNPIRSASFAPSVSRSFNTNAQMTKFDDGYDDDRSVDVERRPVSRRRRDSAPGIFSDVFDPLSPTRSLSQVLNLMDQFMENPFLAASQGMGGGTRRAWDVKENNDALYLRMDMPGVGKENVKVAVEQNTLVIRGEGEKESEDEDGGGRYSSRIDLPPNLYKIDNIKAEMKNGVLKVIVPKVKEEERKDVFQVNVE